MSSKETCIECGATIDTSEWHAAATVETDQGHIEIVSFCSEECRQSWTDSEQAADEKKQTAD